ncbi:tRNA (adenosine(37)-N6)-threonylcarbamoyltransferase complex ATPase subunit type 1 TsaE [Lignipirellula cremea]|uniref:tRNA threonylcarbamoyladenosine biosynthesis protein TsaE n=1 Tax=Lignipirellula cremea TaxID=2528010 RepID=A0A518DW82_9BACT|nr:tRNA (adenosine(37)-N6)-threonylcarbamoyltransferase complex ATPase subunit type 1 TsaE [Lignipirellula cremea]QDU96095.1 tRNA threonylcarbamoyladenosine biosynthesis protein TsaE [Lignipirellula cremea]
MSAAASPYLFEAHSLADTDRAGQALAEVLPSGCVVALLGTLGAGKTRLVQALAAGYGVPRHEVVSPTFVLCQHYQGSRRLHHFDAYRLNDDDEFLELGPDEYFESDDITLIEWADRVDACLPEERLEIAIEVSGENSRRFAFRDPSGCYAAVLSGLAERLAG